MLETGLHPRTQILHESTHALQLQNALHSRHAVGGSLAATSTSAGEDILALEEKGDGLGLHKSRVGKLLVGECTEDTRVQKSAEWGRRKGQLRARDGLAHGVYKREREMEGEEMNVLEEGIRDGGCHSGPSMVDRVRVPHLCTKRLGSYKIPERPQRRERVITRFLEMTRHGGVRPRVFAFLLLSEGPRRSRWQQVAAGGSAPCMHSAAR